MIGRHSLSIFFFLFMVQSAFTGEWIERQAFHPAMMFGVGKYHLYIPTEFKKDGKGSVVVMLHGCMQDGFQFAKGSRMNDLAERNGFVVLYPDQPKNANDYYCWNWFLPVNVTYRSDFPMVVKNEPGLVLQMIEDTIFEYGLDKKQVYLVGMSAGGSMAINIANCYPEKVKALAVHSSVQYRGAMKALEDLDVYYNQDKLIKALGKMMLSASDEDMESIEDSTAKGFECGKGLLGGGQIKKEIPAIVFHGSKDRLNPEHANRVVEQLAALNDYLDDGKRNQSISYQTIDQYITNTPKYDLDQRLLVRNGEVYFARYLVMEMGHAWSGGDNSVDFNDQHGPDATSMIVDFFKQKGL